MITKRIIPCLNVKNGQLVKDDNYKEMNVAFSPAELAKYYCENGADELAFYDMAASEEGHELCMDTLCQVAQSIVIPLTVGGGISKMADFDRALKCGADKVSVNSGVIRNPNLIYEAAKRYGDQCVVLYTDVKQVDGVFRVFIKGGREDTGLEAIEWIKRCVDLGAGEVVINSLDAAESGFQFELIDAVCHAVSAPVVAFGSVTKAENFAELFRRVPDISAACASSAFHCGKVRIPEVKELLASNGVAIRKV